jgi:hypothetical protein
MISRTHKGPFAQVSGSKFALVSLILLFFLIPSVLICNKDYSINNVGFAISQKHNDDIIANCCTCIDRLHY